MGNNFLRYLNSASDLAVADIVRRSILYTETMVQTVVRILKLWERNTKPSCKVPTGVFLAT